MFRGTDIRNARINRGLTQEGLAEKTHYSSRQIGRIENDENLSKMNKCVNLLDELGLIEVRMSKRWENNACISKNQGVILEELNDGKERTSEELK